jgi:hypothetical protein
MRLWHRYIIGVVVAIGLFSPLVAQGQSAPMSEVDQPVRAEGFEVIILGNQLLLDPVLSKELDLPYAPYPTDALAQTAERQLQSYLVDTGFTLARVEAVIYGGKLWLFVDEGKIDEVFFTGAGTTKTAQMQLEFDLPQDIYNQIHLERELERLRAKHGLQRLDAELVEKEAEAPEHLERRLVAALSGGGANGEGADEAEEIWREAQERYSLRVIAVGEEWGRGINFGVDVIGPYGLEVAVGYSDTDLLFDADRYSVELEVGGLSEEWFTGAEAELFYAAPEQLDESVRPAIDIDGQVDNLERETLDLTRYMYLQTDAVALVGFEPRYDLVIAPGVGWGYDNLLDFEPGENTPAFVVEQSRSYPVGQIGLEWLIDRVGFRQDKLHLLEAILEARSVDEGLWLRFEGDYQKAWGFDYDTLFLRANYFGFFGDGIEWYDEDPIASQVIRAVPGDYEFARRLFAVGSEYRLSLYEDLVKAGLSGSAAAANLHNRQTRDQFFELYASGGPGLHLQLLGNFQLNLYYHFGWRGDGDTTGAFSLKFWKIY